ncbi:ABC transporter substrate-binding protein [Rhodopseudomonas sp. BAL398]|nr:ABC transporter substrate-binding protein [Rhodopseudomonas sp. BAL398]MDF3813301.1 ABC transporter substrate-binding protein [Rhodopseudomonas sp. BAL398]WOK17234.1 ABC transporter substrate-binding protein [Rhodopseudomonas sp. BAL398]
MIAHAEETTPNVDLEKGSWMIWMKSLRAVALAASLLSCAAASAETVRVNYIPIADVTPLFVAIDKGYFTAEGLTIVPTPSTGGAAGIPGLMAGAFDVMYGNVVSTMLAQQQGFKLEVISAGTKQTENPVNTNGLVARAGESVKTGKDLEGKTVAVNTRNGIIWLFARAWIAKTGGDPSKVTFKEVPFPQMPDALRGKQVDAAFMVNPFFNAAIGDPKTFAFVAAPYRVVQPGVEVGHYICTQEYYAEHRETIAKYYRAFRKGVQWYNAHLKSPDLIPIISGFTKMKPELVATLNLQPLPETIDLDAVATTVKLMKDAGLLTKDIDLKGMTNPAALK